MKVLTLVDADSLRRVLVILLICIQSSGVNAKVNQGRREQREVGSSVRQEFVNCLQSLSIPVNQKCDEVKYEKAADAYWTELKKADRDETQISLGINKERYKLSCVSPSECKSGKCTCVPGDCDPNNVNLKRERQNSPNACVAEHKAFVKYLEETQPHNEGFYYDLGPDPSNSLERRHGDHGQGHGDEDEAVKNDATSSKRKTKRDPSICYWICLCISIILGELRFGRRNHAFLPF